MKKTENIIIRCTQEQKDFIKFLALLNESSVSELILTSINHNFNEYFNYKDKEEF